MSCNCNHNPCSCANANCACPPSFSVAPATLTCEGTPCDSTMETSCIFVDQYLSCVQTLANTSLSDVLIAMDAKICQCGSCSGISQISPGLEVMHDYYVDSSNTVTGDGTVINPFQTMEEAYNKIIGSGSVSSPDNSNITVHVAEGVGYTTDLNIYTPTISWIFAPNANVTFTGIGTYFIDSSVITGGASTFFVFGNLNFITDSGGFLRNSHSYYSSDKVIYCEANSVVGNSNGTGLPFITNIQTNAVAIGQGVADTTIKLSNSASIIISATQNLCTFSGGRLTIDLNGGRAWYGFNTASSTAAGLSGGNLIYYNVFDASTFNYQVGFKLKNGGVTSLVSTDAISVNGNISYFLLDNLSFGSDFNANKPNTFMNIGAVTQVQPAATNYEFTFLLRNIILDPNAFATSTVIEYSGGSPQNLDILNMADCILYTSATISSTIRLGAVSQGLNPVATKNIINGNLRFTNLPTSASGLATGEIWNNSGVINIV